MALPAHGRRGRGRCAPLPVSTAGRAVKRSPLARKTPLARGTATLTRTAIKPGKRKTRQKMPPGVAAEVKRLSRGRCVRCGTRRDLQRHHVLPVAIFAEYET